MEGAAYPVTGGRTVFEECINFTLLKVLRAGRSSLQASLKYVSVSCTYIFLFAVNYINTNTNLIPFFTLNYGTLRVASGLLRNIQLEICAQDFLYFTLLESPSLCVYICVCVCTCRAKSPFTRIRGLCNVHKGGHSCVHFPPFLLSAIAFRTARLKAQGVREGALLNFWGTNKWQ